MKHSKILGLFFLVCCGIALASVSVSGQSPFKNLHAELGSGFWIGDGRQQAYFLRTQSYGTTPLKGSAWASQWRISQYIDSLAHRSLNLRYAIQGNLNVGKDTRLLLSEAYFQASLKKFNLYAGRKQEIFGIADSSLSSGSYIWSGNALPLPKIQVATQGFVSFDPQQLLSINAGIAHGWFGSDSVQKYFLHQKWFYTKIGKPQWKIHLFAGFNHQVQWGGKPAHPYIEAQTGKLINDYGNDWATYLKVLTGISRNNKGNGTDINGLPLNEALNRSGNHLGTLDIAAKGRFRNFDVLVYRQSIYEDGSLYYLSNISDGLTGISWLNHRQKSLVNRINLEWLRTDNQGGASGSGNTIPQLRGMDNYFNNTIYSAGWTYRQQVIGTPLLTPLSQLNPNLIRINASAANPSALFNNRVRAFSIALSGEYKAWQYQTRYLYSNNWGTYNQALDAIRQISLLQNLLYRRGNLQYLLRLAYDSGGLYPRQLAAYVGVRSSIF